jgi:hypothetical protein
LIPGIKKSKQSVIDWFQSEQGKSLTADIQTDNDGVPLFLTIDNKGNLGWNWGEIITEGVTQPIRKPEPWAKELLNKFANTIGIEEKLFVEYSPLLDDSGAYEFKTGKQEAERAVQAAQESNKDIKWEDENTIKFWNDMALDTWAYSSPEMDIGNVVTDDIYWQAQMLISMKEEFFGKEDLPVSEYQRLKPGSVDYKTLSPAEQKTRDSIQSYYDFAIANKTNLKDLDKDIRFQTTIDILNDQGKISPDIYEGIRTGRFDQSTRQDINDENAAFANILMNGILANDIEIITAMYSSDQTQAYDGDYFTSATSFTGNIDESEWESGEGDAALFAVPQVVLAQANKNNRENRLIDGFSKDAYDTFVNEYSSRYLINQRDFPHDATAINNAIKDAAEDARVKFEDLIRQGFLPIEAARRVFADSESLMNSGLETSVYGVKTRTQPQFERSYVPQAQTKYFRENASAIIKDYLSTKGLLPKEFSTDFTDGMTKGIMSGQIKTSFDMETFFDNDVLAQGLIAKTATDAVENTEALQSASQTLLGINAFSPKIVKDEVTAEGKASDQLAELIKSLITSNPYSGLNIESAGQMILGKYGLTPTGDLNLFPKIHLGQLDENGNPMYETYDPNKEYNESIKASEEARRNMTADQIIGGQLGLLPSGPPAGTIPTGIPGLPSFANAIEAPVYTEQDMISLLTNRYADRPEVVQFLKDQIPYLTEQFRQSQVIGALDQESFMRDVFDPETGEVIGQEEYGLGAPTIDPETGGNIYDISSSTAYSYAEQARPKSMEDWFATKATELEESFDQSRWSEIESKRLEDERFLEDARQRQRFVSQPISIFGRRKR